MGDDDEETVAAIGRVVPGVAALRTYERRWLRWDMEGFDSSCA